MAKETLPDRQILEILYLHDVEGMSMAAVARKLRLRRNQVIGVYHRCKQVPSADDGTMPDRWWEDGLRRQEAFAKITVDL